MLKIMYMLKQFPFLEIYWLSMPDGKHYTQKSINFLRHYMKYLTLRYWVFSTTLAADNCKLLQGIMQLFLRTVLQEAHFTLFFQG